MKKIIAILALAAMLTACSDDDTPAETAQATSVEVVTETTTETITEITTETTTETTAVTTTEAATTSATEAETTAVIEECNCEHEWQHAFAEYINGQDFYMGLYVGDINGDETPEAVIAQNICEWTTILYYLDGEVYTLDLQTSSSWGYVRYLPETNQILFCPFYGHTWGTFGYEEYYLYDWTDEGYVESFSMFRESGYYNSEEDFGYGQGYINGEEVDFDTFEVKLAEIKRLVEENEYFPCIYKDDENYAEYVAENLPCVKMKE